MENYSIYSERFKRGIRISAVIAAIILITSNVFRITEIDNSIYGLNHVFDNLAVFINTACVFLCILLAFFPVKIGLITLTSFLYSFVCCFEYMNPMSTGMFFICITSLYARGIKSKNTKLQITLIILVYFLMSLISLRFGLRKFLVELVFRMATSLVMIITYIFVIFYINNLENQKNDKRLNLAEYEGLDARDAKILTRIQQHIKYDAIAPEVYLGVGALKNRLKCVYTILEVGDKHGFLNRYEEFEIVYDESKVKG